MAKIITHNNLSIENHIRKHGVQIIGDTHETFTIYPTIDDKERLDKNILVLDSDKTPSEHSESEFLNILQLARHYALERKRDLIVTENLSQQFNIINHVSFQGSHVPMTEGELQKINEMSSYKLKLEPKDMNDRALDILKEGFSTSVPISVAIPDGIKCTLDCSELFFRHSSQSTCVYIKNTGETPDIDLSNVTLHYHGQGRQIDMFLKCPYVTGLPKKDGDKALPVEMTLSNIHQLSKLNLDNLDKENAHPVIVSFDNMYACQRLIEKIRHFSNNEIDREDLNFRLYTADKHHDIKKENLISLVDDAKHVKELLENHSDVMTASHSLYSFSNNVNGKDITLIGYKEALDNIISHEEHINYVIDEFRLRDNDMKLEL